MDHVWGYTIVNDVTARDLQGRHRQWLLGKSHGHVLPDGAVGGDRRRGRSGRHAGIRCWVNGELRQNAKIARPDLRHPDADRDDLGAASR